MEAVKVEPGMLKDFSEFEIDQIKRELAKYRVYVTSEFIKWVNDDMAYLSEWVENEINHCDADNNPNT